MIVINSGKMTIPENERFVGFAGDNLHTQKQFLVTDISDPDCIYRLYLSFDDGTTNYFVLDSKVQNSSTLLVWNILTEHIYKSGIVNAQIKAFLNNGEIFHTTWDYFYAEKSAEDDEPFTESKNAEFLQYERELNSILEKINAGFYVPNERKIADITLDEDISPRMLSEAIEYYPVKSISYAPNNKTVGQLYQFCVSGISSDSPNLFICAGKDDNGYVWKDLSYMVSQENVKQVLDKYLEDNSVSGGVDGKSAYQIALDNGFEGTQQEWLESLKGANGKDGAQGPKGDTGLQGKSGADGYTPVKGTDYWTDSDKTEIVEYVTSALTTNSSPAYTNKLNDAGYLSDTRLNSSGTTTSATGVETTGFIPFKRGDIIRLKNIKLLPNGDLRTQQYFVSYDSNKNKLVSHNSSVFAGDYTTNGGIDLDSDGNLILIKTDALPTDNTYAVPENAAYFRISAEEITDDSIITVNEEIKESSSIEVGVTDYVKEEAETVIDKVVSNLGTNTFVFAAITDMHYGNSNSTDGVKHACQALSHISSRIKIDALAVLGDYTDSMGTTNQLETLSDIQTINSMLAQVPFVTPIRVMGNHDFVEQNSPIITRYINSYNDGVLWGNKSGGYFCRDFEDYKLRILVVNTSETAGDGLYCSDAQYNWFASSLDLSAKSNADEWQILILSHMPLDWFAPNGYVFHEILKAYLNGISYSSGDVACDFSGKNSAKIIGNIHGHIHNLLVRDIADGQPNATENTVAVKRIATPEACVGRENSYNDKWTYNPFGETTSYPKAINTVNDTSFCIYCIDLDTHTINAVCYGAGYDRTINY